MLEHHLTDMRFRSEVVDIPSFPSICMRCGESLLRFSGGVLEQDNTLLVTFDGGYGWFLDNIDGDEPSIYLCHECAHGLASYLNLDVHKWHSHTKAYSDAHPEHLGWEHNPNLWKKKEEK